MFKKILVGTLVVGLIRILVVGAINRANAKTDGPEGRGQGRGNNTTTAYGRNQGGSGWGQVEREGTTVVQPGAELAQTADWLTVEGTVASVDETLLVVKLADGNEVTVENRPWQYALESKFSAQVGDQVTLVVFDEGDHFEVAQITNLATGKTIALRDQTGRPGWAGQGRRSGG